MHNQSPELFDITLIELDLYHNDTEDDFETYLDVYNFTLGE